MDVVAYDPQKKLLYHYEVSFDASSWINRKQRISRKFQTARKHYRKLFLFPWKEIEQIAIVSFFRTQQRLGKGIQIITLPDFVCQITDGVKTKDLLNQAVPEGYPLLRAIQIAQWGEKKRKKEKKA